MRRKQENQSNDLTSFAEHLDFNYKSSFDNKHQVYNS